MTFSTAFEAELVKRLGDSGGVRQDSGAGASGIYYECKRAVRLRFQRQLHTPNRRYTFTGNLRGIVDRISALQQTHYGSQYPNGP